MKNYAVIDEHSPTTSYSTITTILTRGRGHTCSRILHDLFPNPNSLIVFSTSTGVAFQNSTSEFIANSRYRSLTSPNLSTSKGRIVAETDLSLEASWRAIRFMRITRHVNAAWARFGWFVEERPCLTESNTNGTASDYNVRIESLEWEGGVRRRRFALGMI
jgi:hypothetical protein